MAVLYSYDYELQRDTVIHENPDLYQVVYYLENGDISLTDALRWCRESGITVAELRNAL